MEMEMFISSPHAAKPGATDYMMTGQLGRMRSADAERLLRHGVDNSLSKIEESQRAVPNALMQKLGEWARRVG
ncbi:hypothetical protein N7468_000464 [Penicillium chermesinum]|uniref:Uncharacterized protein n=1 Tax=Penicillium chermesinum TaxID=63820 RepID=A0A9W9PKA2_9EURO|nr:uncharacterized protein N7468_000464 [Penicillium chermesinum]KAJ5249013.1 hypothetical protein N7468_000464 [Penicillium chermesinum]